MFIKSTFDSLSQMIIIFQQVFLVFDPPVFGPFCLSMLFLVVLHTINSQT